MIRVWADNGKPRDIDATNSHDAIREYARTPMVCVSRWYVILPGTRYVDVIEGCPEKGTLRHTGSFHVDCVRVADAKS